MLPDITIEVDFKDVERAIKDLENALDNYSPIMEKVLARVQEIMVERFGKFQKYYHFYTDKQKSKYAKKGKQVGIKTGDLLKAFQGGKGNSKKILTYNKIKGALAEWSVDDDAVPSAIYFDGWLRANPGVNLVELNAKEIDSIANVFADEFFDRIRKAW